MQTYYFCFSVFILLFIFILHLNFDFSYTIVYDIAQKVTQFTNLNTQNNRERQLTLKIVTPLTDHVTAGRGSPLTLTINFAELFSTTVKSCSTLSNAGRVATTTGAWSLSGKYKNI